MMKPDEQRIAIAEVCGWRWEPPYWCNPSGKLHQTFWPTDSKSAHARVLPDYLEDLNAMHEAEKTLTEEQREVYAAELYCLLPYDENHGPNPDCPEDGDIMTASNFQVAHATAAQRAEAFLRTLSKWTP